MHNWVDSVLAFWFDVIRPEQWFKKDDALDRELRTQFESVYEDLRRSEVLSLTSAREHLAAVIVLDQFPRNMYRGDARAFATDELAFELSRQAIERGLDRELQSTERMFLYMPWQHREDANDQARSVELFESLGLAEPLDYARQHQAVIEQFGRFPHRNPALGRPSTAAETAFSREHPGF